MDGVVWYMDMFHGYLREFKTSPYILLMIFSCLAIRTQVLAPESGCGEAVVPPLYLGPACYPPTPAAYSQRLYPCRSPGNKPGSCGGSGRRPRSEKKPIPEEQKDARYYERRKRNNQAAKKSRDARRMREDQIALRASMLEHENALLRAQVLTLREEAQSLRELLIHRKNVEHVDVCTI